MTKRIAYSTVVWSKAKNKWPNQSGLQITRDYEDRVTLEAINPKTQSVTTNLYLQIPLENIPEVIKALQELI